MKATEIMFQFRLDFFSKCAKSLVRLEDVLRKEIEINGPYSVPVMVLVLLRF